MAGNRQRQRSAGLLTIDASTPSGLAGDPDEYMRRYNLRLRKTAKPPSVELQVSGGYIQWRQTAGQWANLAALSSLQGPQGDTGAAGSTGSQGAQGSKGDKGDTGSQGTTGAQGATGLTGNAGSAGAKGDTGSTGAAGAAGSPANTLIGTVSISQTAVIALSLGVREVSTALAGTVAGERYQAFVRRYKLNGAASWTAGRPSGYYVIDCVCNTAGTVIVCLNAPLLAIGASYLFDTDIVKVNT